MRHVTINDGNVEGDEDVVVTLTDGSAYAVASPDEATVTIEDDDRLTDDPQFCTCSCTCSQVLAKIQQQIGTAAVRVAAASLGPLGAPLHLLNLGNSNPHPVVSVDTAFSDEALEATTIEARLTLGGVAAPSVYYDPATIAAGQQYRISLQADATTLDSGRYAWTMEIVEHYEDEQGNPSTVTRTFNGNAKVNNRIDSPLGNRWAVRQLDRLAVQAGGVQLTKGNGNTYWFAGAGGTFQPQQGDHHHRSLVENADGSYTLTYRHGETAAFDADGLLVARQDAHGNTTAYSYVDGDADGTADELAQILDPLGNATTFSYAGDKLSAITDYAGRQTTLTYAADGTLSSITRPDPDGAGPELPATTSFAYDPDTLQMTGLTDAGGTTTFAYDANRTLIAQTDPEGNTTGYTSQQASTLVDTSGGLGTLANPAPLMLASAATSTRVDAAGNQTHTVFDRFGNPLQYTDALDNTTFYERDEDGRLLSVTRPDPDGAGPLEPATTGYSFDENDNLVLITYPDGSSQQWTYDLTWNVPTSFTDQLGRTTLYTIDPATGEVLDVQEPDGSITTFTYTAQGLTETVTDAAGTLTRYAYNSQAQVTGITLAEGTPDEATVSFQYDSLGNLTAEIDPLGNRTEYTHDNLGRVLTTTFPHPLGEGQGEGPVYSFAYDSAGRLLSETDPLGNTTSYSYTPGGALETLTDALGGVYSFAYDALGQLASETDALGRTTAYGYDPRGLLSSVTDALGNVTTLAHDAWGNVTAATDALGNTINYVYDILSRNTSITDAMGGVTSFAYDAAGQLLSFTDQLDRTTAYTYNPVGLLDSVTDALGNVTTFAFDPLGNLTSETDALGNTTAYGYDALSRNTSITDALGGVVSFAFDAAGQLTSQTDQLGNTTLFGYDNLGQLTGITDALGNVTSYSFDPLGNLVTETDALGNTTTYGYDALSRNTSITDALGGVVSFAFDAVGQLTSQTDQLGNSTLFGYDAVGQLTGITDALGNVTSFAFDPLGNLLTETDAFGNTTTYGYDALSRNTSMTDAEGGVTSFAFDAVSNMLSLTDPVGNTTTWTYDDLNEVLTDTNELGNSRSFVYDEVGNLVERADRNGNVREFDYDALRRLTEERWVDGTTVVNTLAYNYDAASQLLDASDNSSSYTFTYDPLGRRTSVDNLGTPGVPNVVLSSSFDAVGNRTSLSTTIDGLADFENLYSYDALSQMTSVEQRGVGILPAKDKRVDFSYNAVGQFTSIDRYEDLTATALVASSNYSYDTAGRLTNLDHEDAASSTLAFYTWTYDSANRLTNVSSIDGDSDYTYDATNQLTGATNSFAPDESYAYDANGNRLMGGYVIGANNLILSDGTFNYEYDAENNLTKKTNIASGDYVAYTWDHGGRLTTVEFRDSSGVLTKRVEFTYDIFNRKIGKKVDDNGDGTFNRAERYVYDSSGKLDPATGVPLDDIVYVFKDSDGPSGSEPLALSSRLLHGPAIDQVLADEQLVDDLVNEVLWALPDHLGTIRDWAAHDAALAETTVANHLTFDSFGNITSQTDLTATPLYAFTGREWDPDAELYYYRARWYDPALGRFVSDDPMGFAAEDVNVRRYVGNKPTISADPTGLAEGHHWIPVAVIMKLKDEGVLSNREAAYFGGRRSGELAGGHTYYKPYNNVMHADYNDAVETQLRNWKKSKTGGGYTKVKVANNIRDGYDWRRRKKIRTIDRFNAGVRNDIIHTGPRPNRFDIDTEDNICKKGRTSLRRRGKAIAFLGTFAGALKGAGAAGQANRVADVLANGKGMKHATQAAQRGDLSGMRRA